MSFFFKGRRHGAAAGAAAGAAQRRAEESEARRPARFRAQLFYFIFIMINKPTNIHSRMWRRDATTLPSCVLQQ